MNGPVGDVARAPAWPADARDIIAVEQVVLLGLGSWSSSRLLFGDEQIVLTGCAPFWFSTSCLRQLDLLVKVCAFCSTTLSVWVLFAAMLCLELLLLLGAELILLLIPVPLISVRMDAADIGTADRPAMQADLSSIASGQQPATMTEMMTSSVLMT